MNKILAGLLGAAIVSTAFFIVAAGIWMLAGAPSVNGWTIAGMFWLSSWLGVFVGITGEFD